MERWSFKWDKGKSWEEGEPEVQNRHNYKFILHQWSVPISARVSWDARYDITMVLAVGLYHVFFLFGHRILKIWQSEVFNPYLKFSWGQFFVLFHASMFKTNLAMIKLYNQCPIEIKIVILSKTLYSLH